MRVWRSGGSYSPIFALISMANVEAPSANGGLSRQVPSLPYLPALDGLRAIAVAAVIVYHLDTNLAQGGFLGVEVFFVVSGYLITSLLLRELRVRHTVDLRAFWARRARRLLPALVALLVVVGAYVSLFARDVVGVYRGDALASLFYVQNWWQIFGDQSYFDTFGRPSPLRHLWSLAIEEQFYLLWPLLLGAALTRLRRRRTLGLIALAAIASIALMAELADITALDRAYYGTDTRAFGLLVGAALALLWRPGRRLVNRRGATRPWGLDVLALVALAALLWQLAGRSEFDPWTFPWGLAWVDGMTLLLIAAAATTGSLVARGLGVAPLATVGRRSYSLYLWHWPVIVFLRPGVDIGWTGWPANLLRLALIAALAELCYRFVEQPFRDGRAREWYAARRRPPLRPRRPRLVLAGVFVLTLVVVTVAPSPSGVEQVSEVVSAATAVPDDEPPRARPTTTVAPATSTTAAKKPVPKTTTIVSGVPVAPAGPSSTPVTVIGESVTLATRDALTRRFVTVSIDAVVGRQFNDSVAAVEDLAASGALHPTVVVHVGNNGAISEEGLDRILRAIGDRRLLLVTVAVPRRWEQQVNDTLRGFVERHPGVGLIDWKRVAEAEPGLLTSDRVHPNALGIDRNVDLVVEAVGSG
jgi:peptidoglycan/LPS O-acetylase OafA/YrhL